MGEIEHESSVRNGLSINGGLMTRKTEKNVYNGSEHHAARLAIRLLDSPREKPQDDSS